MLSELPFGRPPGKYLPLSIWLHLDTFLFGFEAAPNLPSGVRNCTPYSKFSELALKPLYSSGQAGAGRAGRAGRASRAGRAGRAGRAMHVSTFTEH